MNNKKLNKEINKTIRVSFFAMSTVVIIVTTVSFILLWGNEFNSFENSFERIVRRNSSHFANEIFLEQTEALDMRIQEIISTAKEKHPGAKICFEVNSIHKKNAVPQKIAFRCHQGLLKRDLVNLYEIKLGENIIGNVRYVLDGEGFIKNKLFHFAIIALTLGLLVTFLAQHYFGVKFINKFITPLVKKIVIAESDVKKYEIIKKMAHDSEALLVVLENLLDKDTGLDQEEKKAGLDALSRIRLLNNAALGGALFIPQKEIVKLGNILESSLLEKRIQFKKNNSRLTMKLMESKFDYFINVEQMNLMRVLSNIIDNAVDAIEDNLTGAVSISFIEKGPVVEIAIQDNGKGIPENILKKIRVNPFTYGKEKGNGLGLKNSMDIVRSFNGEIKINSQVGLGSTVFISLPYVKKISSFRSIYIDFSKNVVVLDDMIEIHKIWKDIFLKIGFPQENFYCFNNINEFGKFEINKPTLFFVDYDLGFSESGIDLIKNYSIEESSFLVTSYSNDISLIKDCEKNGIKIISKKEISQIIFKKIPKNFLIHLDDSSLLRKSWISQAKKKDIEVLSFGNPESLFDSLPSIPKESLFFIDKNLGDETSNGVNISKGLFNLGYRKIFLSTGEIHHCSYSFIKGIVGKKFPEDINVLNENA